MAESAIALANQALSEMGTQSVISSFDDASVEAQQCGLWYDRLRRRLLRAVHWGFARRQGLLTLLGTFTDAGAPFPYLYKYAYPSDCIRLRYLLCLPPNFTNMNSVSLPIVGDLLPPWGLRPSRANRFIVANDVTDGTVILTNVQNAIAVYTADITDPSLFDDLYGDALVASLAHRLVVPLSGNVSMKSEFRAEAELNLNTARASDANESIPSSDPTPTDWMATRAAGGGGGWLSGPGPWDFGGWGSWWGGTDSMAWGD